jgi:uncharacterized protein (DUF3084 family)
MSQQFEQREEQLSKKDFAISQYKEIVSRLEEKLKLEEQEVSTPYFEPVSSPEVDSLLNIFLRLNARLLNASSRIDFVECLNLDETEAFKEKDEEIQTLKRELDVKSDEIERLESIVSEKVDEIGDLALEVINKDNEIESLQDKVDELETTVTDREAEIESLKASNTKKK